MCKSRLAFGAAVLVASLATVGGTRVGRGAGHRRPAGLHVRRGVDRRRGAAARANGLQERRQCDFGLTVYQQRGFITQLAAGDHASQWVSTYPGFSDETATVYLHILPREDAGCA